MSKEMKEKGREIKSRVAEQLEFEDRERMRFLKRLDESDEVKVTDWEAQFIESFLQNRRPFTPAQRAAVDGMIQKYEGLI